MVRIPILLLLLLAGCDSAAVAPDTIYAAPELVISNLPQPIDFQNTGRYDITLWVYTLVGRISSNMALSPNGANTILLTDNGNDLAPGTRVGPFPHISEFAGGAMEFPVWSPFSNMAVITDSSEKRNVYYGVRLSPSAQASADEFRYGWIRFTALSGQHEAAYGMVFILHEYCFGAPAQSVRVGQCP